MIGGLPPRPRFSVTFCISRSNALRTLWRLALPLGRCGGGFEVAVAVAVAVAPPCVCVTGAGAEEGGTACIAVRLSISPGLKWLVSFSTRSLSAILRGEEGSCPGGCLGVSEVKGEGEGEVKYSAERGGISVVPWYAEDLS